MLFRSSDLLFLYLIVLLVQIFNWEEWRPIKVQKDRMPDHPGLPEKQSTWSIHDGPVFEEAFKNLLKDFASDLRFYRGDFLIPTTGEMN